jgi:hypothetical protein
MGDFRDRGEAPISAALATVKAEMLTAISSPADHTLSSWRFCGQGIVLLNTSAT